MIMALTIEEIVAIIGAAITLLTAIIIPGIKKYKKYKKKKEENLKIFYAQDKINKEMYAKLVSLSEMHDSFDAFLKDYDQMTVHNLKYMINDAFFGYNSISDIPDDILTNACECCDIYVKQKKRNHEIRPRCIKLWDEQEKRAASKEEHDE